jgi:hypothetical protein
MAEPHMTATSQPILFEEHQRFRQPWLWAMLLGACVVAGGDVVGAVRGGRGSPWTALILLLPASLVWLLYALEMGVRVDAEAVSVRFCPLWGTRIPLDDVISCEPRTYRPILEYGGWGVRYSPFGRGWAYTVSGNRGVQLVLASGRRALVGSQRPQALADAINSARYERPDQPTA